MNLKSMSNNANSILAQYGSTSEIDFHQPSASLVPMVIEKTPNGERSFDIFSRILKENIIFINGEVNDTMSSLVVAQLIFLESVDSEKDISLYINSPGGSVVSGMAMYDTMNFINNDIATLVLGQAASMGTILACAGTQGKRSLLPNAEYMIHQPLGGFRGQASDIEIHANHIQKTKNKLYSVYEKHNTSGLKVEDFIPLCDRDNFLEPERVLELGLADHIRSRR